MSRSWDGKWKLEERLGKGGQGVTHVASSIDAPGVRGALKYLKNNRDGQARGRMRREVANLQTLASAGGSVPHVIDHNTASFEDASTELYVVMDLIAGTTLTDFIKCRGNICIEQSIEFTRALCKTFEIAHTFPIVHRDLKPDNIIVRSDASEELVVVDYGLSFNALDDTLTEIEETFRNRFLDLPETNTPRGDRRDPRSDLTAICAIFYYCLTGNIPGQLQDGSGTLPHMRKGFSLREKHDDERVSYIEEFLTRGFAPNIANRFQTVTEIIVRLNDLLQFGGVVDEFDPVQLAASLSVRLRANDRTTQLAEFKRHAKTLFNFIQKEGQKYNSKLGRFNLVNGLGGMGFGALNPHQPNIPAGLDLVEVFSQSPILQAEHHNYQKHRRYAVASRGEQCVLLAADYTVRPQQQVPQSQTYEWVEVAWFEGKPDSIFDLVSVSYRDWLTIAMKQLADEILKTKV